MNHPNLETAANGPYEDTFSMFAEYASHPRLPALQVDTNFDKNKPKPKGEKSPRPFSFLNGLHLHSSTSQPTTPAINEPQTPESLETGDDTSGRRLIRRGSFILSSGRDKYTYDSETVELPYRSIDVYEKHVKPESMSPSPRLLTPQSSSEQHHPFFNTRRTASQLSSTSSSDRTSSFRSDSRSDNYDHNLGEAFGSPGQSLSSSPSTGRSSKLKRASIVRSAKVELTRPLIVNGRFANPWDTWTPIRFTNILKFGLTKDKSNIPSKEQLDIVLPVVKPIFDAIHAASDDYMAVTWLGHSTVVVQIDGVTLITDPIFSERASPSQMVGPKRYRDPPCSIHDLPSNLDAVLISHNHYDHLDMNSVTLLNARFGVDLRWFVPLGMGSWFESAGCENVVELDWYEENCVPEKGEVSFIFTPAQHWSKRTLNDDNKSLWGGWAVIGPRHKFYFAGDTGYCPVFKEIGRLYGPFTASAIPIGAFEPRWFMKYQHVAPEEAVQIHEDVRSKFSLAVHWGTFALANEYYLDPPVKLRESLDTKGISSEKFVTLKHGETRMIDTDGVSSPAKSPRKKHPHHNNNNNINHQHHNKLHFT